MLKISVVTNILLAIVAFLVGTLLGVSLTGHQIYLLAILMFVSSLITSGALLISDERWQWHAWFVSLGGISGMYAAYYLIASLKMLAQR
ncbi:MAG: hypothetical protein KW788_00495 [Candidatus Doudnabacteria bacterium]|nr:hypothetical protein [Candidatus Doudnabacteria bacterium]